MNQQANSGINGRGSLPTGDKEQYTESSSSSDVQECRNPSETDKKPSETTKSTQAKLDPAGKRLPSKALNVGWARLASDKGLMRKEPLEEVDFCNALTNPQTSWKHLPDLEGINVSFGSEDEERPQDRRQGMHRRLSVTVIEDGKGHEQEFVQFEDDVFSLMIISEYTERTFWYAASIFVFQILMLSLITIDLLDDDSLTDDGNPVNMPIDVEWQVWVAQLLAIVIAAVSQDDVRTSLKMITVGYYPALRADHPGASRAKFVIANLCRFTEGMMSVVVAFIFIVQSDNILDIFLNFAAVEFISNLDNLAYELAATGYVGRTIQLKTEAMEEIQFPVQNPKRKWLAQLFFYILLSGLLSGWSVVRARQRNGYLLFNTSCSTLSVRFGDEVYVLPRGIPVDLEGSVRESRVLDRFQSRLDHPPPLFYHYFSGTYEAKVKSGGSRFVEKNDRPIYYERGLDDSTAGRFYYCEDEMAWVFSVPALGDHIPSTTRTKNCDWGWLAISPQTDVHRLEDVEEPFGWRLWTGEKLDTSDIFHIQCTECDRDTDCSVRNGFCNTDEGVCECYEGWRGFDCHVHLPYCENLKWLDFGESSFDYEESDLFQLFRDGSAGSPLVYERPVYRRAYTAGTNSMGKCSDEKLEKLVLYTGRRWSVTSWCADEREEVFDDLFHLYWDNVLTLNTQQVSAPTDSETPDNEELKWIKLISGAGNYGPLGATYDYFHAGFSCCVVDCQVESICGGSGTCQDSQCICENWFGGPYCEYAPDSEYAMDQYLAAQEYMANTIRGLPTQGYYPNAYHERWFTPVIEEIISALTVVRIDIELDSWPEETGFSLSETETGELVVAKESGALEDITNDYLSHSVALVPGGNYTFVMMDTWGDGLNSNGYNLTAVLPEGDQLLIHGDPDFGYMAVSTFVVPGTLNDVSLPAEDREL